MEFRADSGLQMVNRYVLPQRGQDDTGRASTITWHAPTGRL